MNSKGDNKKDFMYLVFRTTCGLNNEIEKEEFSESEEENLLYVLESDDYTEFYQRAVDLAHKLGWHREKMFERLKTYLYYKYLTLDDGDAHYEAQVLLFLIDRVNMINASLR